MQPQRRGRRRLEKIPFVQRSDLGTYDARNAAIVQKMHKRVDRVEAVCAAALVERGQKGTGNAGERAVRKRERQRGVKDELTFFAAHARDAAAAIRELGGEKSVAKRFEKNEPPYTAEDISEECQIPIRLTNQTLYELQEINLLHEVVTDAKSQDIAYQPSMDISKLNVALLLDKLDTHGSEDFKIDKDKEFHGQWETLMKAREEYYKSASQVLLKDL